MIWDLACSMPSKPRSDQRHGQSYSARIALIWKSAISSNPSMPCATASMQSPAPHSTAAITCWDCARRQPPFFGRCPGEQRTSGKSHEIAWNSSAGVIQTPPGSMTWIGRRILSIFQISRISYTIPTNNTKIRKSQFRFFRAFRAFRAFRGRKYFLNE